MFEQKPEIKILETGKYIVYYLCAHRNTFFISLIRQQWLNKCEVNVNLTIFRTLKTKFKIE